MSLVDVLYQSFVLKLTYPLLSVWKPYTQNITTGTHRLAIPSCHPIRHWPTMQWMHHAFSSVCLLSMNSPVARSINKHALEVRSWASEHAFLCVSKSCSLTPYNQIDMQHEQTIASVVCAQFCSINRLGPVPTFLWRPTFFCVIHAFSDTAPRRTLCPYS